jgi:uncharacterized Zn finger protein
MADLPKITEADIRQWVDEQSFGRGLRYFRDAHIHSTRIAGTMLKGRCDGSQDEPYQVQVTLGPAGIAAGYCSCPVGYAGQCKHAAALLLAWIEDPNTFMVVEDLATSLDRRSKADLIALIAKMVARHPDLEMIVELPVPGQGAARQVKVETLRRQVRRALGTGGYAWNAAPEAARELLHIQAIGDEYAKAGDWQNATAVYETTLQELLEVYGQFQDEGGDLHEVANGCVRGLADCLGATEDPAQRRGILRTLFDVRAWDINYGGVDMGYEAPDVIEEQATAEERREVAGWVRAAILSGTPEDERSTFGNYRREAFGGWLLDLERDRLDEESWLRICRETGRVLDLVDRLLALGRVEEAREVAQGAGDYDLFRMAQYFEAHGRRDLIAELMRERAKTSTDSRLPEWLKKQALESGDQREALGWAQQLFWQRPTLPGYGEIQTLSQALGIWEQLHGQVLDRLFEQKQYALLTEIYLAEGDTDRAIEALGWLTSVYWALRPLELSIRVAEAAEGTRPREAIRLYTKEVEALINGRGRENYSEAAKYLLRVRRLHQSLGEEAAWQALIARIRKENSRLGVLKQELSKVGL